MKLPPFHLFKILLSVWIVFNLVILLIMPNSKSYLGKKYLHILGPYANSVGLNAEWKFFSPDPLYGFYFQYDVDFLNSAGQKTRESVTDFLPPRKMEGVVNFSPRREVYTSEFLLSHPGRVQKFLIPWICRSYPGATQVLLRKISERAIPLDNAMLLPDGFDLRMKVDAKGTLSRCADFVTEDHR